jgi:dTDP-4-amino-4,6-dideoxygalactose transaminase
MRGARPALLGGPKAFPEGLPLVRPSIPDAAGLSRRLQAILESGMLTNGQTVRQLEESVAQRCGVDHAVAVSSCTAGLMLVLQAIGARGKVVMPSFTFAASAHAVVWAGGRPVWGDVRRETMTLDPNDVAPLLDDAFAMTATHVYGAPCDVERLQSLANDAGIPLVYDAAHALGSRRRGRPVGGFGVAEVFSLSPTKVAVAGEGGLVTTDDADIATHIRHGRDYGNPGDYDCLFPGINARMSELHAAVALASLEGLDERIAHRNLLVGAFRDAVSGLPGIGFQHVDDRDVSSYKDLTTVVDAELFGLTAAALAPALRAEGIDSRRYYTPPIHLQQAYARLASPRVLPVTAQLSEQVLTLPLFSHLRFEDMARLADALWSIHEHAPQVRAKTSLTAATSRRPAPRASRGITYRGFVPKCAPDGYFDQRAIEWSSARCLAVRHDFAVSCERADVLAPILTALLASYEAPGEPRTTYRILQSGGDDKPRWVLYHENERITYANTEHRLLGTFMWHVNQEVIRSGRDRFLLLHAAAAARDGKAVILAAPMESGKTTTVTALLRAGYRYLTDEAVALDPHSLLINPFPKPLTLDRGSWVLFPELQPPWINGSGATQWHVPASAFGADVMAPPTPPALLVFPQYEPGAETRLEPVSARQAVELLLPCVFGPPTNRRRMFDSVADLVRAVPRYHLVVNDLDAAVELIDAAITVPVEGATA